jgi:hypothetical protein
MNQHANLILAAENLQRDPDLLRGQNVRGTFALKRVASQTYLVVNELQARVLSEFASPRSVPQVLERCICERKCPALREFYDLILKAHAAGILRTEELCTGGAFTIERPPVRWFLSIAPRLPVLFFPRAHWTISRGGWPLARRSALARSWPPPRCAVQSARFTVRTSAG